MRKQFRRRRSYTWPLWQMTLCTGASSACSESISGTMSVSEMLRGNSIAQDKEQGFHAFGNAIGNGRDRLLHVVLIGRDGNDLRYVRVHVANGRIVSPVSCSAMQVILERQGLIGSHLPGEANGTVVASFDRRVAAVLADELHGHGIAFHLGDENTGIEFAIAGIGHHQFQVIGLARLHHRKCTKPTGDAIVLQVLPTGIVMEENAVGAVVHVVDRNGLVGSGNKSDVLLVASDRVSCDARSADEESEHVVVLRAHPFVVLLGPENEVEAEAISAGIASNSNLQAS